MSDAFGRKFNLMISLASLVEIERRVGVISLIKIDKISDT